MTNVVNNYIIEYTMENFDEIIQIYCVKKKIYYNDEAWVLKKKPRTQTLIRREALNENNNTYLYQTRASTIATGIEETQETISEETDRETIGEEDRVCGEGRIKEETE